MYKAGLVHMEDMCLPYGYAGWKQLFEKSCCKRYIVDDPLQVHSIPTFDFPCLMPLSKHSIQQAM